MNWKPIDFQGIISLDSSLVGLLQQYLDEKEQILARSILDAIPPPLISLPAPAVTEGETNFKLADALEAFVKRNYPNPNSHTFVSTRDWKASVAKINKALWSYVETIEGCIVELFLQVEQTTIEQWHPRLAHVISSIKEILMHKIEDLLWGIKRLDHQLWKCKDACQPRGGWDVFRKISQYWTSLIDPGLTSNLKKSQEFLKAQNQKFTKRYKGYTQLQAQVDHAVEKFSKFRIFNSLDSETQGHFKKLYELLKLWELNKSAKTIPSIELIIALRNVLSIDKATLLFKDYYQALKTDLFNKSLDFKNKQAHLFDETPLQDMMQESITSSQAEARMLGSVIGNYRDFLLNANPDPYVRTRLGFSEGIVGPEPAQTKPLLQSGYDAEALNDLFEKLATSLKKDPSQRVEIAQVEPEIEHALHEMGQPLATHRLIRARAETVLDKLKQLDELGSFDIKSVDFVGDVFAKLLRSDWRYHVLHGIPLFHQLYKIHHGLIKPIDDRHHASRISKFKRLLNKVHEWIKDQKTHIHYHDIELDMNDIKGYLQDFLGYIQRVSNDQNLTEEQAQEIKQELSQQLLEYRYLFGNFFYQLRQHESEGQFIRRQCLFVDQYFESIEIKLHEIAHGNYRKEIPIEDPPTQREDIHREEEEK